MMYGEDDFMATGGSSSSGSFIEQQQSTASRALAALTDEMAPQHTAVTFGSVDHSQQPNHEQQNVQQHAEDG